MGVHLAAHDVRAAWARGAESLAQIEAASTALPAAAGEDLDALQSTLTAAAGSVAGVLEIVAAVVAETGANVEGCLTAYEESDGRSDGSFHGLD